MLTTVNPVNLELEFTSLRATLGVVLFPHVLLLLSPSIVSRLFVLPSTLGVIRLVCRSSSFLSVWCSACSFSCVNAFVLSGTCKRTRLWLLFLQLSASLPQHLYMLKSNFTLVVSGSSVSVFCLMTFDLIFI